MLYYRIVGEEYDSKSNLTYGVFKMPVEHPSRAGKQAKLIRGSEIRDSLSENIPLSSYPAPTICVSILDPFINP